MRIILMLMTVAVTFNASYVYGDILREILGPLEEINEKTAKMTKDLYNIVDAPEADGYEEEILAKNDVLLDEVEKRGAELKRELEDVKIKAKSYYGLGKVPKSIVRAVRQVDTKLTLRRRHIKTERTRLKLKLEVSKKINLDDD